MALVHLVARMRMCGYGLLDTQFVTGHLSQFGAIEIPRDAYKTLLAAAITMEAAWADLPDPAALEGEIKALHRMDAGS